MSDVDDRPFSHLDDPAFAVSCRWCQVMLAGDDVRPEVLDLYQAAHGAHCPKRPVEDRRSAALTRVASAFT